MSIELEGILIDCRENSLIVTPINDLSEFRLTEFESQINAAMREFEGTGEIRNVIIDLKKTDYFGSSTLGVMIRIWKLLEKRGGKMALCNASAHEQEILECTNLNSLLKNYNSLEDALKAIEGS